MFNSSEYPASFTYHYPNTSFDPNPQFSYFPPAPSDHPPGVDPGPISGPYPFTHVPPQPQPPFSEDPNAASHSWHVNQSEPFSYQPSITSLNESLLVPTTADSVWNSNWTYEPSTAESFPLQTNAFPGMSNGVDNVTLPSETSAVGGQVVYGTTSVVAGEELGTKRRKVGIYKICEMCNVTTNSPEVYRKHLAGRKHAAQANLMHRRASLNPAHAFKSKCKDIVKKEPTGIKFVQCVWCEYCKILCNSQDAYSKHIAGKKHQRNLDQLKKLNIEGSAPTANVPSGARNPQIGPMEKVSRSKAPSPMDLETKKQKVISGGAAAGEVRTCTICNVVCNSQIAFSSHLSGQKHAATVLAAKQALEAGSGV